MLVNKSSLKRYVAEKLSETGQSSIMPKVSKNLLVDTGLFLEGYDLAMTDLITEKLDQNRSDLLHQIGFERILNIIK